MKPIWIVVISVIVAGAIIGGGVYYYQNKKLADAKKDLNNQITALQTQVNNLKTSSSTTTATPSTSTTTTPVATDETAGWKTYNDSVFGWQLKYPSSFSVQEKGALGTSQKNVNSVEFRKDNNLAFTINDYDKVIADNQFQTPFSGTVVPASYDTKISEQLTKLNGINTIEEVVSFNNKQSKAYYLRKADNKLISITITSNYLNDSEVTKILNTFQL